MSYDICLQKIIAGDSGLCTPDEAQACVQLLATITSDEPDKYNFLVLQFDDGSSTEISVWDDEKAISGCMFFTRGISHSLLEFIYKMSKAGGFVILDTGGSDTPESPIAIMTSKEVLLKVGKNEFEHPKLCGSVLELSEILSSSSDSWIEYRDHVVESSTDPFVKPQKKKSLLKRLFSSDR